MKRKDLLLNTHAMCILDSINSENTSTSSNPFSAATRRGGQPKCWKQKERALHSSVESLVAKFCGACGYERSKWKKEKRARVLLHAVEETLRNSEVVCKTSFNRHVMLTAANPNGSHVANTMDATLIGYDSSTL